MPKPITHWSYSGLTTFENCAWKYYQVKVLKNWDDSNRWNMQGDDEHSSIERYMKMGAGLSPALDGIKPILQMIREAPGHNLVELKMTLDQQLQPCRGNDWNNAWVRANADFMKRNDPLMTYFDWKSGKPRDSEDQIELTSLLIFQHFPTIEEVRGTLFYYRHNKMEPHVVVRGDSPRLWNGYYSRVKDLENAILNNDWPMNPNPLCGWCPVMNCPNNKVAERIAREKARGVA